MELRQLEYFVRVTEEANFTRAAERVHISQSGISAQVRQLERELGEALLDRSGRTVRLTQAGSTALPYARAALQAVEDLRLAIDQLTGLVRGQVTVGMVSGCSIPVVAELLAEFHERFPGVGITLTEGGSDRLVALLGEGRLDLAVVGSAGTATPGVEVAVLIDDALVAAVCPDHPLAAHDAVPIGSLRDQALVSLPHGTGVRTALDAACAATGFEPRIALEASALSMVVQLASLGLGVAVVPVSTAQSLGAGLHVVHIDSPQLRSRLELAWSSEAMRSPAGRELINHVHAFMERPAPAGGPIS
jgi:DNA-binding transcriptional LysR family regulator